MKKIFAMILLCVLLILSGCNSDPFAYIKEEQFLEYLENTYDTVGREVKTVTFRIKDTSLTFTVTSAYRSSAEIDGSVLQYSY